MERGRPKTVPTEDVIRLRNAGFTVSEIAADLGCSLSSVRLVLRRAGMTGGRGPITIDRQQLLELWASDRTLSEIGAELECAPVTVLRLGRQHQLPARPAFNADPADQVTPEEDAASADSLQLSPWVRARIRELGLGVMV